MTKEIFLDTVSYSYPKNIKTKLVGNPFFEILSEIFEILSEIYLRLFEILRDWDSKFEIILGRDGTGTQI